MTSLVFLGDHARRAGWICGFCVMLAVPAGAGAQEELRLSGRVEGRLTQPREWTLRLNEGQPLHLWIEGRNLTVQLISPGDRIVDTQEKPNYECEDDLPLPFHLLEPRPSGLWKLRLAKLDLAAEAAYRILWLPPARHASNLAELRRLQEIVRLTAEGSPEALRELLGSRDAPWDVLLEAGLPALEKSYWSERLADQLWAANWEAARSLLEESIKLREQQLGPDHLCVADSLATLGVLLKEHGLWDDGRALQMKALQIREKRLSDRHPDLGLSHFELGVLSQAEGRFEEAYDHFVKALPIFREAKSLRLDLPVVLHAAGEALRWLNRQQQARTHFEEALGLAREVLPDDDPVIGRIITSLAGWHKDRGELIEAERLTRDSLRMKEATPDDLRALATGHLNLAEILRLQARYTEAAPHYRKSLQFARQWFPRDSPELVWHLNQSADFFRETGEDETAIELFQEALEVLSGMPKHPLRAQTLHDLAVAELEMGETLPARRRLQEALEIRRESLGPNHPDTAATGVRLAAARLRKPELPVSEEKLEGAVRVLAGTGLYPEEEIAARRLLAGLQRRDGRLRLAYLTLQGAIHLLERLRTVRGGGDASRAVLWRQHLEAFHKIAVWYLEDGRPDQAWQYLERARARVFLDQIFTSGVDLWQDLPPEDRTRISERRGAAASRIAFLQASIRRLAGRPGSQAAERVRLGAELRGALDEHNRVEEEIRQASPLWRQRLASALEPVALRDWMSRLGSNGEAALVYQIGDHDSFLLLLDGPSGEIRHYPLELSPQLASQLRTAPGPLTRGPLREALLGGGPASLLRQLSDFQSAMAEIEGWEGYDNADLFRRLEALHHALVPPEAWTRIVRAAGAVVLPGSWLHHLPFEALVVKAGRSSGETRFWLDDGPVLRYLSSATLAASLRKRHGEREPRPGHATVLSLSDARYQAPDKSRGEQTGPPRPHPRPRGASLSRPQALRRLPGTRRETEAIVDTFGAGRVRVLAGAAATEANFRGFAPGARYLHLATHGRASSVDSRITWLAFTPGSGGDSADDGFLYLFEIYPLSMRSELAVLSACETNLGEVVGGEGVFALSRAFLVAGTARVVATQWPVEDSATARLVADYFAVLSDMESSGRIEYAVALARAKQSLRNSEQWRHPAFWAPFVFFGLE